MSVGAVAEGEGDGGDGDIGLAAQTQRKGADDDRVVGVGGEQEALAPAPRG